MGATATENGCEFRLWAPFARQVRIQRLSEDGSISRELPMEPVEDGHFILQAQVGSGDRYFCVVDDHKPVPDPVSRLLPEGVHGPTQICDPEQFRWNDSGWRGLPLKDYVIYEIHVGAFTPEGTFEAAIEKLPYLKDLGITVIELMPVAAFPGTRNWGYDGVSLYAVQASYGGPDGLRQLVDAAHDLGLGVMLDVVYNHLGNEGNYLRSFGPYFTPRHETPWGEAINYDQPGCEGVRRYVVENALYWIREYHLDGLRLDAVQTIRDDSNPHILSEIAERVHEAAQKLDRRICVIAETDENDEKLVRPHALGGYGLDAIWSDDFHHSIHAFFTGERKGYYQDFGDPQKIARALNEGFVFQGEPFRFWKGRPRGTSSHAMPAPAHVICIQNHDQVGNRAHGERLTALVPICVRMVAAALLLLAPQTPLLFMGQEWDEANPFQFFTNFGDPALQAAVSEGRRNEFKDFDFGDIPDPQDPATFERSRLNWNRSLNEDAMLAWYSSLLALRRRCVANGPRTCKARLHNGVLRMETPANEPKLLVLARIQETAPLPESGPEWTKVLAREGEGVEIAVYAAESAGVPDCATADGNETEGAPS